MTSILNRLLSEANAGKVTYFFADIARFAESRTFGVTSDVLVGATSVAISVVRLRCQGPAVGFVTLQKLQQEKYQLLRVTQSASM